MDKKIKFEDCTDNEFEEIITETSEVWLSFNKHRLTLVDKQKIIDGGMLDGGHITFAQSVLKSQFNCLGCTFYQCKPRSDETKIQCGLQIVHCRDRNHWILATNMIENKILHVYDSVYSALDDQTIDILRNLFRFKEVRIVSWQKQSGGSDCLLLQQHKFYSIKRRTFTFAKQRCVLML